MQESRGPLLLERKGGFFRAAGVRLHYAGEAFFTAATGDGIGATVLFVVMIGNIDNNQLAEAQAKQMRRSKQRPTRINVEIICFDVENSIAVPTTQQKRRSSILL